MRNRSQSNHVIARLGDTVLSLLAIAGGISIVLVILAFTMNVSIMMFRTGSMEPTISTGSIAFVREIPATEMAEGDIITVERGEDLLPVTHRVTDIQHADPNSGAVTFVMRGDANDTDDPEPYTASTVHRTLFAVPGVAPAIQSLQNPLVLGGLTLGATGLVIWTFWPRNEVPVQRPRGVHAAHNLGLPLFLLLMGPALVQHNTLADEANVTTEKVTGQYIRLESAGDRDAMANLAPGQPVTWAVDVWAETPEPGQIDLDLTANGQLGAMATEVVFCAPHPSALLQCNPDTERHLIDTNDLAHTDSALKIGAMSSDDTRRVLITATLNDPPAGDTQDTSAAFHVIATGHDEQLSVGSGPDKVDDATGAQTPLPGLADTGLVTLWLVVLALLLILAGIVGVVQRSTGSRRHATGGACCA